MSWNNIYISWTIDVNVNRGYPVFAYMHISQSFNGKYQTASVISAWADRLYFIRSSAYKHPHAHTYQPSQPDARTYAHTHTHIQLPFHSDPRNTPWLLHNSKILQFAPECTALFEVRRVGSGCFFIIWGWNPTVKPCSVCSSNIYLAVIAGADVWMAITNRLVWLCVNLHLQFPRWIEHTKSRNH